MPRRATEEPKVRLSLEIPERLRYRIEQLRTMSEAGTITEVVRRAVDVYDVVLSAKRTGQERLILRGADGTERELIFP